MLKKTLCAVLFVVLAAGGAYSWKKVDFNRKTAMFFQVVFGGENSMGGPGGRPPMGENRGGDMSRFEPPTGQEPGRDFQGSPSGPPTMGGRERGAMPGYREGEQGGERGAPPAFGPGERGARPPGNGGPGGPGGYISLGNVAKYTVVMAFFVMLARLLDRLFLKFSRSRQPA